MPKIDNNGILLQKLIESVESSFEPMNTESNLNALLSEMGLRENLTRIDVALNYRFGVDEDVDEWADDDDSADEGAAAMEIERPKCTLVIMPLEHQIKQFFESEGVFAKIQSHTAAIEAHPFLNHFIKG